MRKIKKTNPFYVNPKYLQAFSQLHLNSIDDIFNFSKGQNLRKPRLAQHRTRIAFEIDAPKTTLYLKRYDHTPISTQIRDFVLHKSIAPTAWFDIAPSIELTKSNINTPEIVAFGSESFAFFEKRSFCITAAVPNGSSLEKNLPQCFNTKDPDAAKQKIAFTLSLADFAAAFHQTGFCHRDFYLCHIFNTPSNDFYLIDLTRAFKPAVFKTRYKLKDLAQLYYSAPGSKISTTNRLRFYLRYRNHNRLTPADKKFIRKLLARVKKMARHDRKRNISPPFEY
jgi:UDP-glucose:(heptosyl)LPS alpha-1,3-glucosyltransferase/heptose I phosphotransferase